VNSREDRLDRVLDDGEGAARLLTHLEDDPEPAEPDGLSLARPDHVRIPDAHA
jgi:hypothetical protein